MVLPVREVKRMIIVEQIVCWLFGGGLLYLAFRLVHKDKWGFASVVSVLVAVSILCGQSWFQGFMKSEITSVATSTLQKYGDKLDDFQNTVTNMKGELARHQKQIGEHQTELERHQKDLGIQQGEIGKAQTNIATQQGNISRQYGEVETLQRKLDDAETNIAQQQARIEDVEFLVKNLFSKMTVDDVLATNSELVKVLWFTNGAGQVFVKLQHPAIAKSVQGFIKGPGGQGPLISIMSFRNVASFYIEPPKLDFGNARFILQYVQDTRETNTFEKIEFDGTKVFFDGRRILGLNQDKETGRQ